NLRAQVGQIYSDQNVGKWVRVKPSLTLTLAHAPVMRFKDFQAIRFCRTQARANARESVPKIAVAVGAVVLGHGRVQHYALTALTGVLERSLMRRLDPHLRLRAVHTRGAISRLGPDMDVALTRDTLNH